MDSKLIIIRGNSGSGKTSVAKSLRQELGRGTMLIQQDVVRRDMLYIQGDAPGNHSVNLIHDLALYGKSIGFTVIIEGILQISTHGDMLRELAQQFKYSYAYYFGISFHETLRRHATKPNASEFGEKEMRDWWREKDYLNIEPERILTDDMKAGEVLEMILSDVRGTAVSKFVHQPEPN